MRRIALLAAFLIVALTTVEAGACQPDDSGVIRVYETMTGEVVSDGHGLALATVEGRKPISGAGLLGIREGEVVVLRDGWCYHSLEARITGIEAWKFKVRRRPWHYGGLFVGVPLVLALLGGLWFWRRGSKRGA